MNGEVCDSCGHVGMIGPMDFSVLPGPMGHFGKVFGCPKCKNLKKA